MRTQQHTHHTTYTSPQSHILLATTALSVFGLWWWLQRHADLSIRRSRQLQRPRVQIRQYLDTTTLNIHLHDDGCDGGDRDCDDCDREDCDYDDSDHDECTYSNKHTISRRVQLLDIAYKLGSGATADVLQVTSTNHDFDGVLIRANTGPTPDQHTQTGKYAIKIMRHDNICFKPHDVASEISVLRAVATCKNTIDYIGVAYMDKCTVIVMRPFGNGRNTLSSWMTKWSGARDPGVGDPGVGDGLTIMMHLFRQLSSALAFLERRRIVHRDVRPANILIDNHSSQHLKLIDFGLACRLDARGFAHGEVGSPKYAAPEVWSGFSYDHTIDWWSAGLILSEMTVVVANRRDTICSAQHGDRTHTQRLKRLHTWIQEGIRRHDMTPFYNRLREYDVGSHPIRLHIARLVSYNPAHRATSHTLYVMDTPIERNK